MRVILNIIILFAVLFQACSYSLVLLDFSINKSFISSNLCEKRNVPLNKCHGKCYLKKQLEKQGKDEHSTTRINYSADETPFFNELNKFMFYNFSATSEIFFNYKFIFTQENFSRVFRPPLA